MRMIVATIIVIAIVAAVWAFIEYRMKPPPPPQPIAPLRAP
jgi:hypothetical protein